MVTGLILILSFLISTHLGGLTSGLCALCSLALLIIFSERKLKQNILKILNLLDQLNFPVALLDSQFRYRFFSTRWSQLLRLPTLRLLDHHFEVFKKHTKDCQTMYRNALKGETFTGFRRTLEFDKGTEVLDFGITGIELNGRKHTFVFINPVTELEQNRTTIAEIKEQIQRYAAENRKFELHLETLKIINKIANLAVSNYSLYECLEKALDYILKIPSVSLKPQAGIFLANTQDQELQLYCTKNFHPNLLKICNKRRFGECLCGKAALEREIQFSSCVDHNHTITYDGITPHGHYNVPLIFDGELVGVLVVYLPEGHQKTEFEIELMNTLGAVLAGLIKSKQNYLRLKENQAEKEALIQKQRVFFGAISHDIRNYIQGILSHAELALDNSIPPQEALAQIERASHQTLLLLSDLLDMIRFDSTQITLQNEPFTVGDLFSELKSQFIHHVKPNVSLTFTNYCPDTTLLAPVLRIKQILLNLVSNALKFTLHGAVQVTAKIHNTDQENNLVKLQFVVRDTGVGIPQEKITKIFDPFSRVDDSSKGKEGYGLGLAICKKLVEALKGEIYVESEVGYGTTFTVIIPVIEQASNTKKADSTQILTGPLKILIVEDDPVSSNLLRKILESGGHTVLQCDHGRDALELIESEKDIKLVILDYELPFMNGLTLASKIKETRPDLPIFLLTGNESLLKREANNNTVSQILTKPITKRALLEQIAKLSQGQ